MNNKDFEILENADDETVEKLGNKYPVFDEKKREEIYKMTMKKMKEQNESTYTEYSEKIEGVEKYKRPVWQRVSAVAAAAAIVAGGFALFRNIPREGKNKGPDYMTEVTTDTTEPSTAAIDSDSSDPLQNSLNSAAKCLYTTANAALTEMNEEKEITGIFIISSDPSQNYNVSSDFNIDSFYEKLKYYNKYIDEYDYFFVIRKHFVFYTVCEKKQYDDILQFVTGQGNGDDENSTGLIATYPYRTVPLSLEEGNLEMTAIADLLEKPTDPLPSIHEIYDICVKLMSEGSSETTDDEQLTDNEQTADNEQTSDDLLLYEGEDYQEYVDTATDLIDKYQELIFIPTFKTEYDKNDEINFKVIPTDEEVYRELESDPAYVSDYQKAYDALLEYYASSHAGRYNRCTDERFTDIASFEEYAHSIVTDEVFNELFVYSQYSDKAFTDEIAGAKDGDTITLDRCSLFTMYNNKLYINTMEFAHGGFLESGSTDTYVYNVTETSFIVEQISMSEEEPIKYLYSFSRNSVNDEWRVDKI